MDKRMTTKGQLALPFYEKPETKPDFKNNVKQHWNMTFARQPKMSVVAKRIFSMVLAQIRENDNKLKPYFELHVTDVITEEMNRKSAYKEVKKAFKDMISLSWLIEDIDKRQFTYRHLLDSTKPKFGYQDGLITVALNPMLEPYFIELAHYTKYQLDNYMKFESWYSMRLWEILSAFRDQGWWYVPIDEYRKFMDCEKKYSNVFDLIKYTLSEPERDFKGTKFEFEVEQIRSGDRSRRGAKPVVALEFRFKHEMKTIPPSWYRTSKTHDFVLKELVQKYKVEEINIIKYGRFLGLEGLSKLRYQFETKQLSSKKINDFAKYCNKVLIEAGEKAKEAQK
jgi:plasmid replication initiation protein